MAVTEVKPLRTGKDRTIGKDWKRTYTRTWQVITDDPNTGPITVTAAVPVAIGDRYTNDNGTEQDYGSFCISIRTTVVAEDGLQWNVVAEYGAFDPTQWPENPLLKPPDIEWTFKPFEKTVDEDIDGNAVVNTAGDAFDPPLTCEDPRPVLMISRNEATFDPSLAYTYKNAVNTDVFFGAEPSKCKVSQISGRRQWDQYLSSIDQNGGFYWTVTYEFEFTPDTWQKKVLNQGLRKLNESTGQQEQITIGGAPITSPVLLDESGQPLEPGAEPYILEFRVYPEFAFADAFNLEYPGP